MAKFYRISREELEAELEADRGDTIRLYAEEIEHWSDFSFITSDGRKLGLFLNFLANNSIELRLRAAGVGLNASDTARLQKTAGFILEIGSVERPFVFAQEKDLIKGWVECHRSYGVPLTDEEREILLDEQSDEDFAGKDEFE